MKPVLQLQTLAIRFATVDNAEAFKAAFLEARQYVLENQVGLRIDIIFLLSTFIQARQIREEERGEADGEETPDPEKTAAQKEKVEEGEGEVNSDGDGKNVVTEEDVVSKIADLAV